MDRTRVIVVSTCLLLVFAAAGCGDAATPRIDGPGGQSNPNNNVPKGNGNSDASVPDGSDGIGYGNPQATDAGCQPPNLTCNGVCIAIESDPTNCGGCGNACIGGDAVCLAGTCSCTGPLEAYCDGVGCMDVSSDFNNCGACGNACDPNADQACTGGVCVPNCCN